jgi:hypothetical protein
VSCPASSGASSNQLSLATTSPAEYWIARSSRGDDLGEKIDEFATDVVEA